MSKKKSFIISAVLIFMFIGVFSATSYVWLTSAGNNPIDRIKTENMDITFSASDELNLEGNDLSDDFWDLKTYEDPIFNFEDFSKPGDSLTRYIKVENSGDVDLDFFIEFSVQETSILAEVIEFNIEKIYPNESLAFSFLAQDIYDVQFGDRKLVKDNYQIYMVNVKFLEVSDDRYNSNGQDLTFVFDIFLYGWASNEVNENDLTALLENVNLVTDWRQLKFVLPETYLSQIEALNVEKSVILESRILKDLLLNRPLDGYLTISHFNSIFDNSLRIQNLIEEKIDFINSDNFVYDENIFSDVLDILNSSNLEIINLSEVNKNVEELRSELDLIIDYSEAGNEIAINQVIQSEDLYDNYYSVITNVLLAIE